ncbi:hypothetical protein FD37_GL000331 [Levilactobacillus spicheri DSM 15429]|nr:hypothetical protein FD37_GL000331 [Levilactobacillus spicheri DSM 15429]
MRDTGSVVGAMSVLLILYDLMLAKDPNWVLVPFQIILALIAVGAWSYFSYRSQEKRKLQEQRKAEAAERRAAKKKKLAEEGAKQAAQTRARNVARNQQHQQHRHD